jgi:DNA polymerase-3 subunit gamma/tau
MFFSDSSKNFGGRLRSRAASDKLLFKGTQMPQALYRKWRPRRWDSVVAQEHVIQTLHNAVTSERVAHAYLFAGPRGTGKTTTARLLAKAVNCLNPDLSLRPCDECDNCLAINAGRFLDLIEIDAASNTSVDDVRDLREKINFSPNLGRYKVYVIDEVHMLSTAAFNALLKTLEEPPSHAIFVLATTEVHKIPATVLSRCQRHEFRRIPVTDIVNTLSDLAQKEGLSVTPDALALIARQSTGSLRDAISLLDQLSSAGEVINLPLAQSVLGTATSQAVIDLVAAVLANDPGTGLEQIHRALDTGSDARQFARQIVDYLRSLLLIQIGEIPPSDETPEREAQMVENAQAISTPELLRVIRLFNQAVNDSRATWQPALPLEVALIESCQSLPQPQPLPQGGNPAASVSSPKTQPPARTESSPESGQVSSASALSPADDRLSNEISEQWPQVLNIVREKRPNLSGLLNSCQSRHLNGSVLVLGFASDLVKNMMDTRENLAIVQEVISQLMGTEIAVRCGITTAKNTDIPTEVDGDGMVASALRDLGGEIVDIQ